MIARRARISRAAGAFIAGALIFGGVGMSESSPAMAAAAGNCTALKDVMVKRFDPDPVRAIASCSFLGGATEARGFIDMLGCCDQETAWFRNINVNHYTDWTTGNYERVGTNTREY